MLDNDRSNKTYFFGRPSLGAAPNLQILAERSEACGSGAES